MTRERRLAEYRGRPDVRWGRKVAIVAAVILAVGIIWSLT
jgi:hypothetical protein